MSMIENFPLGSFIAALRTLAGRIALFFLAVLLGTMLGGLTATRDLGGAWSAVVMFPLWGMYSLFSGWGLLLFPLAALVGVLFIRSEWPSWIVGLVALLMWWCAHQSLDWIIHRSEGARVNRQIEQTINEAAQRHGQEAPPAAP
jgi:hypothetical protein